MYCTVLVMSSQQQCFAVLHRPASKPAELDWNYAQEFPHGCTSEMQGIWGRVWVLGFRLNENTVSRIQICNCMTIVHVQFWLEVGCTIVMDIHWSHWHREGRCSPTLTPVLTSFPTFGGQVCFFIMVGSTRMCSHEWNLRKMILR